MKAAVIYENGPPSVLKYEDVADPVCGPGDILIRVEAIGIEGGDLIVREMFPMPSWPHILGPTAGGTIIEVGADVRGFKVGDKVATFAFNNAYASLRAAPAATSWMIPDGLSVKEGCTIPVTFGTADDCLFEYSHLQAGETVLVQAGASGVGLAAIQLAKLAGATVIATASSDERLAKLKQYGLDHGINYLTHDLVTETRRLTDGKGANLIVDPVGGKVLRQSLEALAYRGRIAYVGFAGHDADQSINPRSLLMNNQSLNGVMLGVEMETPRVRDMINRLLALAAERKITMPIDKEFALKDAAAAHEYIGSRKALGRVILIP